MVWYGLEWFLFAHIICDYYMQSSRMALNKKLKFKWVIAHGCVYAIAFMGITLPILDRKIIGPIMVAAVMHLMIDLIKYAFIKHYYYKRRMTLLHERRIYLTDQMSHLIGLFTIITLYSVNGGVIAFNTYANTVLKWTALDGETLFKWLLAIALVHKPANITISKILAIYKPDEVEKTSMNAHNAGRLIGTVERILMIILISIHQFAAIGLVLTAKSIARYDRISKEKDFAEYYLLGTLMSTVAVIVVAVGLSI